MDNIAAFIAALFSVSASAAAVIIALRKAPHEVRQLEVGAKNTEADVASKYQSIAEKAAERALKLDDRMLTLEKENELLRSEMNALKASNEDLREWADRLVHQVIGLGGTPVKIRVRAARPREI